MIRRHAPLFDQDYSATTNRSRDAVEVSTQAELSSLLNRSLPQTVATRNAIGPMDVGIETPLIPMPDTNLSSQIVLGTPSNQSYLSTATGPSEMPDVLMPGPASQFEDPAAVVSELTNMSEVIPFSSTMPSVELDITGQSGTVVDAAPAQAAATAAAKGPFPWKWVAGGAAVLAIGSYFVAKKRR